jgi:hypothetical protein
MSKECVHVCMYVYVRAIKTKPSAEARLLAGRALVIYRHRHVARICGWRTR